jgi:hypothetical protein
MENTSEDVAAVRDEEVAAARKSMYGYAQTSYLHVTHAYVM